jgi:hypothetical protein
MGVSRGKIATIVPATVVAVDPLVRIGQIFARRIQSAVQDSAAWTPRCAYNAMAEGVHGYNTLTGKEFSATVIQERRAISCGSAFAFMEGLKCPGSLSD